MKKIYWFRKDLRLEDNTALREFLNSVGEEDSVAFIYIKNRNSFRYFGEKRISFLVQCLEEMSGKISERGYTLQILNGSSVEVIDELLKTEGSFEVYCNRQVEPYCIARDAVVERLLKRRGSLIHFFDDTTLLVPGSVVNQEGAQYKVYTPFRNQALNQLDEKDFEARKVVFPKELNEFRIKASDQVLNNDSLPETELKGGRSEGIRLLKRFYNEPLEEYRSMRDFPSVEGTSKLSPHFHFGTVGIREAYRAARKKLDNLSKIKNADEVNTWINELLWREFYYHITWSNPRLTHESFRKEFDNVEWSYDEKHFEAWKEGRTGYPIVDAGMRQLVKEGWMHNRVRMITAMFLTKDLLIDWRHGEKYFAEHLIDLDFSSNNGGWQWSASTGVDAQPYFRIFNPYLQSKKFDAEGNYIRKYVKELAQVPSEYIHEPHKLSNTQQEEYGVIIGKDYPLPIVDHARAKKEVLRRFGNASGKPATKD